MENNDWVCHIETKDDGDEIKQAKYTKREKRKFEDYIHCLEATQLDQPDKTNKII